jgi:hypothetical protein
MAAWEQNLDLEVKYHESTPGLQTRSYSDIHKDPTVDFGSGRHEEDAKAATLKYVREDRELSFKVARIFITRLLG